MFPKNAGLFVKEIFDYCCSFDIAEDLDNRLQSRQPSKIIPPEEWPSAIMPTRLQPPLWPPQVTDAMKAKNIYFFKTYLLRELSEACVTVNNRLFLWDPCSPTDPVDVRELRLKKQGILSVAYIKLRTGFSFSFPSTPRHVLTITTTEQVLLAGLSGLSEIVPLAGYSCPVKGVFLQALITTASGRIFCGGNDGHLYEVIYYTMSGFLYDSGGLQLVKQTWWFKDYFFDCPVKKQVESLYMDEERLWLYLVRKEGSISLFSLGENGTSRPQRLTEIYPCKDCSDLSIFSLSPIPLQKSKSLAMVVIMSNTQRRFYRVLDEKKSSSKVKIELAYVLEPMEQKHSQDDIFPFLTDHLDGGFCISTEQSRLEKISSITQVSFNSPRDNCFSELTKPMSLTASGRPLCIAEFPLVSLEKFKDCEISMDDFHLQYLIEKKPQFALLTREVILIFEKMYPVRHLRWILRKKDLFLFKSFVEFYGSVEVAAMCWNVGLEDWDLTYSAFSATGVFHAAQIPERVGSENVQRSGIETEHGDVVFLKKLCHSDLFKGFCLYIARLLKPIWKRKLFTEFQVNWRYDLLLFYNLELQKLTQFLSRAMSEPHLQEIKDCMMEESCETSRIAASYEVAALRRRRSFLFRCFEGIHIVMFLERNDVGLDKFHLLPEEIEDLKKLEFGAFLQYRTPVMKLVTGFCGTPDCSEEQKEHIRHAAPSFFCPPSQLDHPLPRL